MAADILLTIPWRHNEGYGVSNHKPHNCLLKLLFRHRSKKTSKLHITGLCERNSPVTGEFPAQRASNAENVSIWWHHRDLLFHVISSHDIDYIMTSSNGNIFCITGPLWAEFTSHWWIPLTKASDAELWCFLWSAPEQIPWHSLWCHCNDVR